MDLGLAAAVSLGASSVLGPLGITILVVTVLVAGSILSPYLTALALACSGLAILLTACPLILAAIDAVLIAASCPRRWAVSILCCQGKTGQQA